MEARERKLSGWAKDVIQKSDEIMNSVIDEGRSDGSMTEKEMNILLESERIMKDYNIYTSPIMSDEGELIGVVLKDSLTADKVDEIYYKKMIRNK